MIGTVLRDSRQAELLKCNLFTHSEGQQGAWVGSRRKCSWVVPSARTGTRNGPKHLIVARPEAKRARGRGAVKIGSTETEWRLESDITCALTMSRTTATFVSAMADLSLPDAAFLRQPIRSATPDSQPPSQPASQPANQPA
ncbi:unnamed protein product [Protopolystoma xenopodis]|uniref:Uncharacterized protein n=1 Tax=Protopolystoma xenopodis TaxID=117903 RepID=A0A448WPR3_9PLAT|nr:unnamed protein product [Protopolystoma xenopodis]